MIRKTLVLAAVIWPLMVHGQSAVIQLSAEALGLTQSVTLPGSYADSVAVSPNYYESDENSGPVNATASTQWGQETYAENLSTDSSVSLLNATDIGVDSPVSANGGRLKGSPSD
jgi:hypothetical protein